MPSLILIRPITRVAERESFFKPQRQPKIISFTSSSKAPYLHHWPKSQICMWTNTELLMHCQNRSKHTHTHQEMMAKAVWTETLRDHKTYKGFIFSSLYDTSSSSDWSSGIALPTGGREGGGKLTSTCCKRPSLAPTVTTPTDLIIIFAKTWLSGAHPRGIPSSH